MWRGLLVGLLHGIDVHVRWICLSLLLLQLLLLLVLLLLLPCLLLL